MYLHVVALLSSSHVPQPPPPTVVVEDGVITASWVDKQAGPASVRLPATPPATPSATPSAMSLSFLSAFCPVSKQHTSVSHHLQGLTFTLGLVTEELEEPQDIYSGSDLSYAPIGLVPGKMVRFVVNASNFFGCSEYSEPSEPVQVPEVSQRTQSDSWALSSFFYLFPIVSPFSVFILYICSCLFVFVNSQMSQKEKMARSSTVPFSWLAFAIGNACSACISHQHSHATVAQPVLSFMEKDSPASRSTLPWQQPRCLATTTSRWP